MNIYIIEDEDLIIAKKCVEARRFMNELKEDEKYLEAKHTQFRRISGNELMQIVLFNNLGYGEKGELLETHLDTKIGIELEYFEPGNWKHLEN